MRTEAIRIETTEDWRRDECVLDRRGWTTIAPVSEPRPACAYRRLSTNEGGVLLQATFSPDLNKLIAGEFEADETGDLIAAIHGQILGGNRLIVHDLVMLVLGGITDPDDLDARCLALEILATSRVSRREALVQALVQFCLASSIERLQFRAIGAANTLPKPMRRELCRAVEDAISRANDTSSARRIGVLFLSHNR